MSKFKLGDEVNKTSGSQWHGRVVGGYSTGLTKEGYVVESSTERGSVQNYPAAALEGLTRSLSAPAHLQSAPVPQDVRSLFPWITPEAKPLTNSVNEQKRSWLSPEPEGPLPPIIDSMPLTPRQGMEAALAHVTESAAALVDWAQGAGIVLEINTAPLQPLAQGNYEMVVSARPTMRAIRDVQLSEGGK